MISRALRLMKDLSVAEVGNVQADPESGANGKGEKTKPERVQSCVTYWRAIAVYL